MYLNHYNLNLKPFQESPDPIFFWLGEKHAEAFTILGYGIRENKGFIVITGDVGTGKTSLINYFLLKNDADAIIATIANPELSTPDFFKLLSIKLKLNNYFSTEGDFLIQFENFLHNKYSEGKKVILIIDEAQRLNWQLIEQIRLLSNIERRDAKLINIFFVGQNELFSLLLKNENKALGQRVSIHYDIKPLSEDETQEYISHRLRIAGVNNRIFSYEAVHEIYTFSKGYPRLINTICDCTLLTGYISDKKNINSDIVKQSVGHLKFVTHKQQKMKNDDLSMELDASNPDTIKVAVGDLIEKVKSTIQFDQIKAICKNQNFLEAGDDADFINGDIIVHDGQVAFQLNFNISYNLSVLLDRNGKLINVYRYQ
jgi:general secretion pathway protein A